MSEYALTIPKTLACAYCGEVKAWTGPHFVIREDRARVDHDGQGEFYSRAYAECWSCWERESLRSAREWASRPLLLRIFRRWS